MVYSFSALAQLVDGDELQANSNVPIKRLAIDSRLPISSDSLFIAIKGPRHNGHAYLSELYKRGVRSFLVSEQIDLRAYPEANVLKVSDTKRALQLLAAKHRAQFTYPLIGITGSNGKTTVKEWLSFLLADHFSVIRSPRSYNSQIGVPLSLWEMDKHHELAIIEAGISERNEMQKLQQMIKPNIGLLTNIGEAHQAGFDNLKEKTKEKLVLFEEAQLLVYRKGAYGIENVLKNSETRRDLTWSTSAAVEADFHLECEIKNESTNLLLTKEDSRQEYKIPFTDEAAIENAVHCIVLALHLEMDSNALQEKLNSLKPLAMRLEMIKGFNNCTLINDAYSADIHSLRIALDTLDRQVNKSKKTVVLSDFEQSDKEPQALHKELAELLKEHKVNRIVLVGKSISQSRNEFNKFAIVETYDDTQTFLSNLSTASFNDEAILVKGARKFQLEKIVSRLAEKKRQTVLEVNLNRVQENLNYYKSLLKPQTKLMVMVKALSYGAGSMEISKLLQYNQVDYLCVAYTDEGVELRKAGIHLPIMVLNTGVEDFAVLAKHKLEPVIYSLEQLKQLDDFLSVQSEIDFPIHIEFDTGMHRLGIMESDLENLKENLQDLGNIKVQSIFSHLSSSDEPSAESFTRSQFELFDKMYQSVLAIFEQAPLKHILNTAGIENFPDHQYDMVRLGIGLYGISQNESMKIKSVSSLKSFIAQIKELKAGESIGYNRNEVLKRDSKIAIVNIGYGDGLPRKCGNRNYAMLIAGQPAPIVGNVCMDMCMLDVSDIPKAKIGMEVLVFGDESPVQRLAEIGNTISYEILTGISPRVKRLYLSE